MCDGLGGGQLLFWYSVWGLTNDMVFIMWHVIRHDSPLLTWILNLIIQFISCLQTELAVVKADHRIRDCVLGKDTGSYCFCCLKDKEHTHTHTLDGRQTESILFQLQSIKVILFQGILSFYTRPSKSMMISSTGAAVSLVSTGPETDPHLLQPLRIWIQSLSVALTHKHRARERETYISTSL